MRRRLKRSRNSGTADDARGLRRLRRSLRLSGDFNPTIIDWRFGTPPFLRRSRWKSPRFALRNPCRKASSILLTTVQFITIYFRTFTNGPADTDCAHIEERKCILLSGIHTRTDGCSSSVTPRRRAFIGNSLTGFVEVAAEFLGELNAIHPFREGNGRAATGIYGTDWGNSWPALRV